MRRILIAIAPVVLVACSGEAADDVTTPLSAIDGNSGSSAGTRPAGEPSLVTFEGRIEEGTECRVLRTPDGERWAFNVPDADFAIGDYVELTGEVADASFCMEGRGTLIVQTIEGKDPPARDRDPARAGGIAISEEYVVGRWVAKGANADCDRPEFAITLNRNGMPILESAVNGVPTDAAVRVRPDPAFVFDAPLPDTPIETRGPDGLAVLPPRSGEITIAGHAITGDGIVFVNCP